ncbi:hypothetical protein D082_26750 [Synechocystis sp. PCC 6714]|nr:hypothetical protein D082_26750 [Synechocystis sp. PCC 6714]
MEGFLKLRFIFYTPLPPALDLFCPAISLAIGHNPTPALKDNFSSKITERLPKSKTIPPVDD